MEGAVDIRSAQRRAWQDKLAKGFNTTDVPLEFCLLNGEVAEAFDAWRKNRAEVGEELADIAIFLLSLAARRQRTALPGWLAVAGMVIGVLLVASVIGTPALLLVVWLLLVAATGFRSDMVTRSR